MIVAYDNFSPWSWVLLNYDDFRFESELLAPFRAELHYYLLVCNFFYVPLLFIYRDCLYVVVCLLAIVARTTSRFGPI